MITDLTPIILEKFNGLFARTNRDNVPLDHLSVANNLRYFPGGFRTRGGLASELAAVGTIARFHVIKIGSSDRLLVLNSSGSIYDSQNMSSAILTIGGMVDFSCLTLYDRVYITPHDRVTGKSGSYLYVYTGSGSARTAGGASCDTNFNAADGAAGVVAAGVHKLALVYETDTGFLTKPGPIIIGEFVPTSYTAPGAKKINLTNLQVAGGGTGVTLKHIVATKAGLLDYYFVPNGTVVNAVTSLTIDFTDAQLVDSADYLFDTLSLISAGLGLARYQGRMVLYGFPSPNGSLARVSRAGNAEQFSDVDGNLLVDVDNKRTITNVFDLRGSLYVVKEQGVHAYVDNGLEPSEWKSIQVDDGIGSTVYGVANVLDESGQTTDKVLLADRQGLVVFDGLFHGIPLTWKIQDSWDSISPSIRNQTQVVHDPVRQLIFVTINSAYLLVGDYNEGLNPQSIKWSVWTFSGRATSTIGVYDLGNSGAFELRIGSGGNVFKYVDTVGTTDAGSNIISTFSSGFLSSDGNLGAVNFFGGARLRINGSGSLSWSFVSEDLVDSVSLPVLALQSLPGKEFFERCNLQTERASLTLTLNSGWMQVNKIRIFSTILWPMRPSI